MTKSFTKDNSNFKKYWIVVVNRNTHHLVFYALVSLQTNLNPLQWVDECLENLENTKGGKYNVV